MPSLTTGKKRANAAGSTSKGSCNGRSVTTAAVVNNSVKRRTGCLILL